MNIDKYIIGQRIKKERERLGIDQTVFGEETLVAINQELKQVGRTAVYAWENGTRLPKLEYLLVMCEAFDCELGYLLGEPNYENRTRIKTDICNVTNLSEEAVAYLCENKETSRFTSYLLENLKGIEKAVADEKALKKLLKQWQHYDDFDVANWCFEKALKNAKKPLTVGVYFDHEKESVISYARELYYQTVEFEEEKEQLGFNETGDFDARALILMLNCLYELSKHDERLFVIQKIFLDVVETYMKQE
jgi:transcriptional regulator with XRE-family HTH domain